MSDIDKGDYKHIYFRKTKEKKKTAVFECKNKSSDDVIGIVEWYSPWRQYCFFPEWNTVFSRGCLNDINSFISTLMEQRRLSNSSKESQS